MMGKNPQRNDVLVKNMPKRIEKATRQFFQTRDALFSRPRLEMDPSENRKAGRPEDKGNSDDDGSSTEEELPTSLPVQDGRNQQLERTGNAVDEFRSLISWPAYDWRTDINLHRLAVEASYGTIA